MKRTARLVRSAVNEELRDRLPFFQQVRGAEVPPGWVLYEWRADESLTFYLLLVLAKRFEEFSFDIGWSRNNSYPQCLPSLSITDRVSPDEFRMALPLLWRSSSAPTFWWSVMPKPTLDELANELSDLSSEPEPDDAMEERVKSLAVDAVERVARYAVPFFASVAREFGLTMNIR